MPWPVFEAQSTSKRRLTNEDLTLDAITSFVLPRSLPGTSTEEAKKYRKDRLRETMLRFHPDKFEGRIMKRVREKDRDQVLDAVGRVARALNTLMGEGT